MLFNSFILGQSGPLNWLEDANCVVTISWVEYALVYFIYTSFSLQNGSPVTTSGSEKQTLNAGEEYTAKLNAWDPSKIGQELCMLVCLNYCFYLLPFGS